MRDSIPRPRGRSLARGQRENAKTPRQIGTESSMGILHGHIIDSDTGEQLNAKVHVLTSNGRFSHPSDALLKRGPGMPSSFAMASLKFGPGAGAPIYWSNAARNTNPSAQWSKCPNAAAKTLKSPSTAGTARRKTTGTRATRTFTTTKKKPAQMTAWASTVALRATTSRSSACWTGGNCLMRATNIPSA